MTLNNFKSHIERELKAKIEQNSSNLVREWANLFLLIPSMFNTGEFGELRVCQADSVDLLVASLWVHRVYIVPRDTQQGT